MNSTTTRTALRLLVATPIAISAIALGSATAQADPIPAGPGVIVAQPGDDPTPDGPGEIALPEPKPEPKPQGPGDLEQPKPEPKPDPKPQGPGDITNPDDGEDPKPHGPGDITNPEDDDDPKPQGPGDLAIPDPQDGPEDEPAEPGAQPGGKAGDGPAVTTPGQDVPAAETAGQGGVEVPSRIDAGAGSALGADEEQGAELLWLLAGGGALTAAGAVLARQRLARRTR